MDCLCHAILSCALVLYIVIYADIDTVSLHMPIVESNDVIEHEQSAEKQVNAAVVRQNRKYELCTDVINIQIYLYYCTCSK